MLEVLLGYKSGTPLISPLMFRMCARMYLIDDLRNLIIWEQSQIGLEDKLLNIWAQHICTFLKGSCFEILMKKDHMFFTSYENKKLDWVSLEQFIKIYKIFITKFEFLIFSLRSEYRMSSNKFWYELLTVLNVNLS